MRSVALLVFGIHLAYADFFSITCEDVTGSVEEELTLTCTFSDEEHICCNKNNKFRQIARNDSSTSCKGEFSTDPCVKMTNFSCSYTADAMITKIKFFLQTKCESIKIIDTDYFDDDDLRYMEKKKIWPFELIVAAGCVLPFIIFAAIMGLIVWMKSSQVKRQNLKGYVTGSTTDADLVSDQEMQKYSSCASMHAPTNF